MSIEKFHPVEVTNSSKRNFLNRLINKLTGRESLPINEEYYNSDQSRQFEITEWRDTDGFRQLNIKLFLKYYYTSINLMSLMTRWEGSEQLYGIEIEALVEEPKFHGEIYNFNRHNGGKKIYTGTEFSYKFVPVDEAIVKAKSLGLPFANDLPEFIDFDKTAIAFQQQAIKRDFSIPRIYPKELLEY